MLCTERAPVTMRVVTMRDGLAPVAEARLVRSTVANAAGAAADLEVPAARAAAEVRHQVSAIPKGRPRWTKADVTVEDPGVGAPRGTVRTKARNVARVGRRRPGSLTGRQACAAPKARRRRMVARAALSRKAVEPAPVRVGKARRRRRMRRRRGRGGRGWRRRGRRRRGWGRRRRR
jgi:hypothetical protein